ncbi:restriction endonuclease paci restriction endonuclease [Caudoviricetes sp.]|nr:restriction endonuclease paci restriction endonuclease [Caudoviricetes sp.]
MKPKRGPNWRKNKAKRVRDFNRARQRFADLCRQLGNVCAKCGSTDASLFSIDHVDGITWNRRKLRYDARISKYIAEHAAGVRLRVLCIPCNSQDGANRVNQGSDYVPF